MADTNASGYSVDEYEITSIELGEDECVVTLGYGASGDQHEDRMYLGETIRGEAVAVVDDRQHVTYRDVSAEVVHSDEDLEDIPSFAGATPTGGAPRAGRPTASVPVTSKPATRAPAPAAGSGRKAKRGR